MEENILALSLYKQSRKSYNLLRELCNMPSPKTLNRLLQKVSLRPGLCKIIIQHLKKKRAQWIRRKNTAY